MRRGSNEDPATFMLTMDGGVIESPDFCANAQIGEKTGLLRRMAGSVKRECGARKFKKLLTGQGSVVWCLQLLRPRRWGGQSGHSGGQGSGNITARVPV